MERLCPWLRGRLQCAPAFTAPAGTEATAHGAVLPITNGSPGTGAAVPGTLYLSAVACLPGSTTCYASGEASPKDQGLVLPIVDGVPGAAIAVKGSTNLDDVTCPTSTTCYASGLNQAGDAAVIVTIHGGGVSAVATVSASSELVGIGCTSATLCLQRASERTSRWVWSSTRRSERAAPPNARCYCCWLTQR